MHAEIAGSGTDPVFAESRQVRRRSRNLISIILIIWTRQEKRFGLPIELRKPEPDVDERDGVAGVG